MIDVDGEGDEKYEIVRSDSGSVITSSTVAVEFVVTDESLTLLRVVRRDHQNSTRMSSAAEQQDVHSENSCKDASSESTGNTVTAAL